MYMFEIRVVVPNSDGKGESIIVNIATYYNENTRILGDYGSNLYVVEQDKGTVLLSFEQEDKRTVPLSFEEEEVQ